MVIVLFEHALFLFCYHCLPRTQVDEYCDGGDNDMMSFCLGGVGGEHGAAVVEVKVRHSRSCNRVAPVHTMKYLLPMPVPTVEAAGPRTSSRRSHWLPVAPVRMRFGVGELPALLSL